MPPFNKGVIPIGVPILDGYGIGMEIGTYLLGVPIGVPIEIPSP